MYNTSYLISKRKALNLSQEQVAQLINMDQGNYSKLEAGLYSHTSLNTLTSLHKVLHIDLYYFLNIIDSEGGEK